jgi:hypothetical protein
LGEANKKNLGAFEKKELKPKRVALVFVVDWID